jgi:Amt family ammonium transporter
VLGAATGAVAGLVAITPACGFVDILGSLVIGAGAGMLCYKACSWKNRLGYDDALDVVGVHGVGGTWGALVTGLVAVESGAFYGFGFGQFGHQVVAVLATYVFVGVGSLVILGLINMTVGLRVDDESEEGGLDLALHSESAYSTQPGTPVSE